MSGCACVYTSYDGDTSDVTTTTKRVARKPHTCCECRQTIQRGQTYEHTSGLWDGDWQTYKTCLPCVEIRHALMCEGWNYQNLWEDIREHWHQGGSPTGCIKELETADAKQKLADAYRDFLGLEAADV